ncbi:hypothetical protein OIU79_023971 [Salix purpurea]|uniref:Uncharacterized protein n=1 Tax=Salix purpurea TaxID=77065 RepID=A0A9Q0WCW1_SALPP|nr:hypothetical protein OIU79_023971 [Salix purpurea]
MQGTIHMASRHSSMYLKGPQRGAVKYSHDAFLAQAALFLKQVLQSVPCLEMGMRGKGRGMQTHHRLLPYSTPCLKACSGYHFSLPNQKKAGFPYLGILSRPLRQARDLESHHELYPHHLMSSRAWSYQDTKYP